MPHLDETDPVLALAQGLENSVYSIPGKAENDLHPPIDEAFNQDVTRGHSHGYLLANFLRKNPAPPAFSEAVGGELALETGESFRETMILFREKERNRSSHSMLGLPAGAENKVRTPI
jgi:hypothetical protein